MRGYLRALSAETLKYRRTMAVWLALGIPVLIAGLATIILTQTGIADESAELRWQVLEGFTAEFWPSTCLHIGGAILIGMLWGLEHSSNQLKHVLAQPVSRHAMFWAKTTGILGLIAIGTLLLSLLMSGLAIAIGISPVQWHITFAMPFRAYLAAIPTIALISWVAQRRSSFALPLILGVVGLIVGAIAGNSDEYWPYVPWAWSMQAAKGAHELQSQALLLAAGGSALLLGGSWWHFVHSDTPS